MNISDPKSPGAIPLRSVGRWGAVGAFLRGFQRELQQNAHWVFPSAAGIIALVFLLMLPLFRIFSVEKPPGAHSDQVVLAISPTTDVADDQSTNLNISRFSTEPPPPINDATSDSPPSSVVRDEFSAEFIPFDDRPADPPQPSAARDEFSNEFAPIEAPVVENTRPAPSPFEPAAPEPDIAFDPFEAAPTTTATDNARAAIANPFDTPLVPKSTPEPQPIAQPAVEITVPNVELDAQFEIITVERGTLLDVSNEPFDDKPFTVSAELAPADDAAFTAAAASITDDWREYEWKRFGKPTAPAAYQPIISISAATAADFVSGAVVPYSEFGGTSKTMDVTVERLGRVQAGVQEIGRYELLVRNHGATTIDHLVVTEKIAESIKVIDVSPPAAYSSRELRWQVTHLKPGADQVLTVSFFSTVTGEVDNVSRITPTQAIAFRTQVDGPKLGLVMTSAERVETQQHAVFQFQIANVGTVPVSGAILRVDLPDTLTYHEGRRLDYNVGDLQPGQVKHARLTTTAIEVGTAKVNAEVIADGTVHVAKSRVVTIAHEAKRPKSSDDSDDDTCPTPVAGSAADHE